VRGAGDGSDQPSVIALFQKEAQMTDRKGVKKEEDFEE